MSQSNRLKLWWIFAITVLAMVGIIAVVVNLAGPREETEPLSTQSLPNSSGGSGAVPASPDETPRATKTDRDPASSLGDPPRDQSFRPRLEKSKKIKAIAVEATRALAEHGKQYPHRLDRSVVLVELEERIAATTDPKERAALTRKSQETAAQARQAAEAARTPEVLQHERRLRVISRLESFLDLPAYISEGTEFSDEAEALLAKVADFAERSPELDDEAVIAGFSTLDTAIKDLRRRRAESMPQEPERDDD